MPSVVPAVDPSFNYNPPQAPPPYAQAGDVTDPSSPPPSYEEIFNKNDGSSGADTGVRSTVWTVEQAGPAPVLAPVATPPPQGRRNSVTANTQNTSCTRRRRRLRMPFTCCPGTKQDREARIQKFCILLYGFLIPACQISVVAINGLDSCRTEEFLPTHQLVAGIVGVVVWGLITVRIFHMDKLSSDRVYIESKPTNAQGMVRSLFVPVVIFLFAWTCYGFVLSFPTVAKFYGHEEAEVTTTAIATPSTMSVTSPSTMWSTTSRTNTTHDVIIDRRDCSEEVLLVAFCAAVVQALPLAVVILALIFCHLFSCKPKP